jgi:ketosteroid isomerase-like protein
MTSAELLAAHLSLVGKQVTPDDLKIYSDDFVAEFPYAPEDHTRRLEGGEAMGRFLSAIGNFAEAFKLGEPTIHETKDGFVAEYRGESIFKSSGRPYVQDYVVIVKVKDGKIAHWKEHYDPMRVLRAMGEID